MSVIRMAARSAQHAAGGGPVPASAESLTGVFRSPSGRTGGFRGSYRLEHCGSEGGRPTASGVVTGELVDADGSRIGVGARRLTASVAPTPSDPALVRVGPLDVDLLGFAVRIEAFVLDLSSTSCGPPAQAGLRLTGLR